MSAKDNFNQAMNDMFGAGKEDKNAKTSYEPDYAASTVVKTPTTYIAAGTVIEGKLCSSGDVEVAGTMNGDIEADGRVTLHTDVTGNIKAAELSIPSCKLTGDAECTGRVTIGKTVTINGNIHASEIICAGMVIGDLSAEDHITLENSAIVNGKITTVTMSMDRGAILRGGIEMRDASEAVSENR